MKETFAFLRKTPWYNKEVNPNKQESLGGLFNGYVAIRKDIYDSIFQDDSWDDEDSFRSKYDMWYTLVPQCVHGGITCLRLMDSPISMYPLTDIPKDYVNNYVMVGFDTGHIDDDSDIWTYEAVKKETLGWRDSIQAIIDKSM